MAHSLVATASGSDYEIAPAGPTAARCIDVVDLGMQTTVYEGQVKVQHKIVLYWVTTHLKEDGSAPLTVSKRYTLSLHEKATLTKDLQSWRGKPFEDDEARAFDIEKLLGAPCFINVIQRESNGKTYANVDSIMPLPKGTDAPTVPGDYIRHIERNPSRDKRSDNYQEPQTQAHPVRQPAPVQQQQEAGVEAFEPSDSLPF